MLLGDQIENPECEVADICPEVSTTKGFAEEASSAV